MVRMARLPVAIGMLLLIGGCSDITVEYDYDPAYDFSKLRTFDWLPIPVKPEISQLSVRRIKSAVTEELQAKGFRQTSSKPDFTIAAHIMKEEKVDVRSWGYCYGPTRRYRHWGYYGEPIAAPPQIDTFRYEEGTLILDFVEAKSKEMIWRGTAKRVLDPGGTPEEHEKAVHEVAGKILENFPPTPKGKK